MIWQTRNIPIFLVVIILSSDGQRHKPLVPLQIPLSQYVLHHLDLDKRNINLGGLRRAYKAWGTTDNTT